MRAPATIRPPVPILGLAFVLTGWAVVAVAESPSATLKIRQIDGLVAFWTFDEPSGQPRRSGDLALIEQDGPIERSVGGPLGFAATLRRGQYFKIDRANLGRLDIHGPEGMVTVVA